MDNMMFKGQFEGQPDCVQRGCQSYKGADSVSVYFWGNIFNRKALGYTECPNSAELVYHIYFTLGASAFNKIDGSFTFIIHTPNEVLIGRDHHGTGLSVYYNSTHYASSLTLLTTTDGFVREPDYKALSSFLSVGYIATPSSAFANVWKLGAGMLLKFKSGKIILQSLFPTNAIMPSFEKADLEDLSSRYGELHSEAIRRRIEGKANVGILLSGGYDSGSNLAALRQQYNGDIQSFSIGFRGDNSSELPLAKCMSDTFHTIHTEYEIDGSEISALPEIVRFLGDPFVEGGLMVNYAVMKLAGGNKTDVILGGDGSDQYFGTSGREIAIHCLLAKNRLMPIARLLHSMVNNKTFDKNSPFYRINFQMDKIIGVMNGDFFGFPRFRLSEMVQQSMFLPETKREKIDASSFEQLYTRHQYETDIEKTINQVILFKASRMAEYYGNNIVFPYLDNTLYDFLQQLPVEYKCRSTNLSEAAKGHATAKFLLKYHYKPLLPSEITSKKKQGGFAPMPLFFADKKRRDSIAEYILSSGICNDFLKKNKLEAFVKQYDREADNQGVWFWYRQNRAIQYFNLYTLALWWETFMSDGR